MADDFARASQATRQARLVMVPICSAASAESDSLGLPGAGSVGVVRIRWQLRSSQIFSSQRNTIGGRALPGMTVNWRLMSR